ncbi:nicotinate phosphoribosyltransferase [Ruminococcaceae bacterium OttesenSCG-928-N02]|nr:nicotinate phosphoribosyltransferase [Ruminococcaceae bacterium OttesenSCG-928-N02]
MPNLSSRNLSMLADFYELSMAAGFFAEGTGETIAVFDMFFRRIPDDGGFALMAGLEQLIEYLQNLHFDQEDIAFLRARGTFSEEFLQYLANFRFTCDVWAIPEGTPIFPGEPLVTVRGPIVQAQLIETALLTTINHQCLIATKANRMVRAAQGRPISEFGARRAQSYDAAAIGARAAYIGGCANTSCVLAQQMYGVTAVGTMAHSWVQMFESELAAFTTYAKHYPHNCILLVDTYNVLRSGVPNAIRVFDEVLAPMGIRPKGIRIDSGDIAYLSKKARAMLDAAGYADVKITASNSLDEHIIQDLLVQGAQIDAFGVGEKLITAKSEPVFGGVYKLVAVQNSDGNYIPKIKVSETAAKITTPHMKKVYRVYDNVTNNALADYIAMADEVVDEKADITLFDPNETWKRRTYTNVTVLPLMVPIFEQGALVYTCPPLDEVRQTCLDNVAHLWDETKRFEFPHKHYVDLSQKLWDERQKLLEAHSAM